MNCLMVGSDAADEQQEPWQERLSFCSFKYRHGTVHTESHTTAPLWTSQHKRQGVMPTIDVIRQERHTVIADHARTTRSRQR